MEFFHGYGNAERCLKIILGGLPVAKNTARGQRFCHRHPSSILLGIFLQSQKQWKNLRKGMPPVGLCVPLTLYFLGIYFCNCQSSEKLA